MAILEADCDICHIVDKTVCENDDGIFTCKRCQLVRDIRYKAILYKEKRDWVKNVWITSLKNMKQEILDLQKELKDLTQSK